MVYNNHMLSVSGAVLLVLGYTDQFDYPLSAREIWLRLPRLDDKGGFGGVVGVEAFVLALKSLSRRRLIEYKNSYFFLQGKEGLVSKRQERRVVAAAKTKEIQWLVGWLRLIPGIVGVALTGSLAVENAKKDDDVDFLIITKPGCLWLVRPLVVFIALINGKRRSWHREEKNSWCFNMWLTTRSMRLSKNQHNIYTAYDLCQTRWLVSKNGVSQKFFRENSWAGQILPHYYRWAIAQTNEFTAGAGVFPKSCFLISLLNKLAYKFQLMYMQPHRTREKVGLNYAYFHPRDTRRQIMQNWLAALKEAK